MLFLSPPKLQMFYDLHVLAHLIPLNHQPEQHCLTELGKNSLEFWRSVIRHREERDSSHYVILCLMPFIFFNYLISNSLSFANIVEII